MRLKSIKYKEPEMAKRNATFWQWNIWYENMTWNNVSEYLSDMRSVLNSSCIKAVKRERVLICLVMWKNVRGTKIKTWVRYKRKMATEKNSLSFVNCDIICRHLAQIAGRYFSYGYKTLNKVNITNSTRDKSLFFLLLFLTVWIYSSAPRFLDAGANLLLSLVRAYMSLKTLSLHVTEVWKHLLNRIFCFCLEWITTFSFWYLHCVS